MTVTINGYRIPDGMTSLMGIDPSVLYELGIYSAYGLVFDELDMDGGALSREGDYEEDLEEDELEELVPL